MPEYAIIRLGKDSVPDIRKIDSLHNAPDDNLFLTVKCTQVPLIVSPGYFVFIYLGSDNSKGIPTSWNQGLRALGKIKRKSGGPNYGDKWQVDIDVKVIFPESINKDAFVEKAAEAYSQFSHIPIIGLYSYSNQTIQRIKSEDPKQNIYALFYALETVCQGLKEQIKDKYPELSLYFENISSNLVNIHGIQTENKETEREQIEGLDTSESSGWDDYPLDSVFVRSEQRTVNEVVKRINNDRFILNPDFQRSFVWDAKMQSRLIESCLMRIPLPVFYVAESIDGRIIVVDGLQRLYTFKRYLGDEFALTKLEDDREDTSERNPFIGKRFSDLSITLQERLEDTQLTLYILDANAPDRAKLDIFERVNSGAPLSRQQMRNSLFSGPGTKWLANAADNSEFLKATDQTLNRKSMRDREVINRFCAFYLLGMEQYKGDMDSFLAKTLDFMNKKMTQIELEKLCLTFEKSMKANFMLFKRHAFRKSLADNAFIRRTVINVALFDVCSVVMAKIDPQVIADHSEKLKYNIGELIRNDEFAHAISYSTNDLKQVKIRFYLMEEVIKETIS